jgi:aminopeptidase N
MLKKTLFFTFSASLSFFSLNAQNDEQGGCREKCFFSNPATQREQQLTFYQYPSMNKYDVKYVKIDIAAEANSRSIEGSSITRAIAVQALDTFIVEFKNTMILDSVFINGIKKTFTRDNDHIQVPLSPAIAAGAMVEALFYYKGTASANGVFAGTVASNGLAYTASLSESYQAREWWPSKQLLKDKIDSADIWITTSSTNKAGSNGLLKAIVDKPNNKKQYQWSTRYPIAYYLLSFAIGNYMEYTIYAKPLAMAPDSIPVQNYIVDNATYFNTNKVNIDKTPAFIEKMSELYGLYPFKNEKYGHAMANIGGGMEHQTMTTLSSFGSTLIAHELGHQWFGDNVTCATWNHIWINEGFATYSEYLMIEKLPALFPTTNPTTYMQNVHTDVLSVLTGSVFVPDASLFDENRIFSSRLSYNKGAAILHTLRFEMQDDNKFFQTLKTFQQQFKDSVATADDFRAVAETVCGRSFADFFNQWYYGQGYPTFNVDYSKTGDSIFLKVNQTVSAPFITPFFKGLYEFKLNTAQGDTTVKVNLDVNDQVFKFKSPRMPTGVVVDPNNWVLNKVGSITTGIRDIDVSNEVKLFPNPSPGILYLQYPANSFDNLQVFDIAGKLLQQRNINRTSTQQTITTSLQTGVYFVRLNGKGKVAVKKLIITSN